MWLDSVVLAFKSDFYFNVYFAVQFLLVFTITSLRSKWFPAYGKTYVPGSSRFNREVNGQLAFYLSHVMTPVVYIYTYRKLKGNLWAIPSVLFLVQMFYRVVIYPSFRRTKYQKVCPLETVVFQFLVSVSFGFSIGRLLALHPRRMGPFFHIMVLVAYVPVTIALYVHDFWICRSRHHGPDGYMIMHKGLFKTFTCAQYTLQGLQWLIFSIYIDSLVSVWSYLVWLVITLLARATICHEYFIQSWPRRFALLNKYAMIPVRISRADKEK